MFFCVISYTCTWGSQQDDTDVSNCNLLNNPTLINHAGHPKAIDRCDHSIDWSPDQSTRLINRPITESRKELAYCLVQRCMSRTNPARGVATGTGVYRYIYPPKISPWKLFCALIAADVFRLLVYAPESSMVLLSKICWHVFQGTRIRWQRRSSLADRWLHC